MTTILVGIDGSERGRRALEWAISRAGRDNAAITMLAVIDSAIANKAGVDSSILRETVEQGLAAKRIDVLAVHPGLDIRVQVAVGDIVDALVDAANEHDMVVVGSHHGHTIGETIGGAKGLRISVSAKVPTVIVPADWSAEASAEGIVMGLGPDESVNASALEFAAGEALATGWHLELISAWGLPAWLERGAEAMGGGLGPVGEQRQAEVDAAIAQLSASHEGLDVSGRSLEGTSPSRVLVENSADAALLVLGTNSRNALGRTLFGSVTHSVLLNLAIPTVIVPRG